MYKTHDIVYVTYMYIALEIFVLYIYEVCSLPLQDAQTGGGLERGTSVGSAGRSTYVEGPGMDSLLPIVSSQRERFKQRNVELEAVSYPIRFHQLITFTFPFCFGYAKGENNYLTITEWIC